MDAGVEHPSGSSIGGAGNTGVSPPQAERPFRLTLTAGVSFDYELIKLLPGTAKCADEVYGRCPPGRPLPGD